MKLFNAHLAVEVGQIRVHTIVQHHFGGLQSEALQQLSGTQADQLVQRPAASETALDVVVGSSLKQSNDVSVC